MMNQMTQALKEARIAPTQISLVWRWVKDHPGCLCKDLVAAMNGVIKPNNIGVHLRDLEKRGMLRTQDELLLGRHVKRYTAIGDTYQLKPVLKTKTSKASPAIIKPEEAPASPVDAMMAEILRMPVMHVIELRKRINALLGS